MTFDSGIKASGPEFNFCSRVCHLLTEETLLPHHLPGCEQLGPEVSEELILHLLGKMASWPNRKRGASGRECRGWPQFIAQSLSTQMLFRSVQMGNIYMAYVSLMKQSTSFFGVVFQCSRLQNE